MRPSISIRGLEKPDFSAVQSLLARESFTHTHIDWRPLASWLDDPNLIGLVAHSTNITRHVVACLAAMTSPDGSAWLRLAALANDTQAGVLDELWSRLRATLKTHNVSTLGVLPIDGWLANWLGAWGFGQTNAVITLAHRRNQRIEPPPSSARLRAATRHDLPGIIRVDTAAFAPLWRHDQLDLLHAQATAAMCVVAEWQDTIVGYQISTQHGSNGHLARLAVDPGLQGQGIGRNLVAGVLAFFERRGIQEVTVNTQRDNLISQRLYKRMGFELTGHSVPIWTLDHL